MTSRTLTSSGDAARPYGTLDYQSWAGSLRAQAQEKGNQGQYAVASYLLKLNMALITYEDLPAKYILHCLDTFKEQEGEDLDSVPSGKACRGLYEERRAELRRLAEEEDPLAIPKLKRLVELLKDTFESNPNSRGMLPPFSWPTWNCYGYCLHCENTQGKDQLKCLHNVGYLVLNSLQDVHKRTFLNFYEHTKLYLVMSYENLYEVLKKPLSFLRFPFNINGIGLMSGTVRR